MVTLLGTPFRYPLRITNATGQRVRGEVATLTPEEIAEFRALLAKARAYDLKHHAPSCESEEKVAALKAVAKTLGVDIAKLMEADA